MHPMLTTAVKAARRAGNVITRGARDLDLLTVTAKGPKDFVSEVDRAAEAAIVETIHSVYPEHAILAEEGTGRGRNPDAEHLWTVDLAIESLVEQGREALKTPRSQPRPGGALSLNSRR